jgi:hypothetical protein
MQRPQIEASACTPTQAGVIRDTVVSLTWKFTLLLLLLLVPHGVALQTAR